MQTNNTAAHAKIRLAKRAKRARFWKENKSKILLLAALVVVAPALVVFTPVGPNWYKGQIKQVLDEYLATQDPEMLTEAIEKTYNLSQLYAHTLRPEQAFKEWDRITEWYYGYRLSEWSINDDSAAKAEKKGLDARRKNIREGKIGVPYDFPPEAIPYLEKAILNMAESFRDTHRTWRFRILQDKYLGEFAKKHPADPENVKMAEEAIRLYKGTM